MNKKGLLLCANLCWFLYISKVQCVAVDYYQNVEI